jgi:hypothetical protein
VRIRPRVAQNTQENAMNIIRHALAIQLIAMLLATPLAAHAVTGLPQPPMQAGGTGAESAAANDDAAIQPDIHVGGCVIEAGGLTLESDADTVFSVLEGESGRTVLVRSGRMDFDLAEPGNTEFATPFGSVSLSLADTGEAARGSVHVGRDTATLTVTKGVLLLAAKKEPLSAGRVLVLTNARGKEPTPAPAGTRPTSVSPRVAVAFGGASALAAGGLILAGMAGGGGDDDSREISPH